MTANRRADPAGFNLNIQGARGLFSLLVLLFHVSASNLHTFALLEQDLPQFMQMTLQFGVELFFCISSFVIAGTLRRALSPGRFLTDRAVRLFSVLWFTLPVSLALELASHAPQVAGLSHLAIAAAFIGNLLCLPPIIPIRLFELPAWSLSYELAFYIFCAVSWWLVSLDRRARYILVVPAIVLIFCFPRALMFLVGIAAAEGTLDSRMLRRLARYPILFLVGFVAAWGEVRMLNGGPVENSMMGWWFDGRLPLTVVAIGLAIPGFQGIVDGVGLLGRLLRSRVMQWFGKISFSLYLWQFVTMALVKRVLIQSGLADLAGPFAQLMFLAAALPPTLVVAWISQKALEGRLSGWIRRGLHPPPAIHAAAC